jgi:hypothetical protein
MIDYRRDYDENNEAHDRHRRIVELMRMQGANNTERLLVFGVVVAIIIFYGVLIFGGM